MGQKRIKETWKYFLLNENLKTHNISKFGERQLKYCPERNL